MVSLPSLRDAYYGARHSTIGYLLFSFRREVPMRFPALPDTFINVCRCIHPEETIVGHRQQAEVVVGAAALQEEKNL